MKRILPATVILVAGLALGACESMQGADSSSPAAAAAGTINDRCPIAGQPVDLAADTAEWQGGTVGFCCNGCAARWDDMSDDERAARIARTTG